MRFPSPFLRACPGLARALATLLLLALALGGGPLARAQGAPTAATPLDPLRAHELTQADFARRGRDGTVMVELPDTWRQRGDPGPGLGVYTLHFTLAQVPPVPWALRTDRLSTLHAVRLNGVSLAERLSPVGATRPKPMPIMFGVPTPLLRAGDNTLEIELHAGRRAGLSPVWIGEASLIEADWELVQLRDVSLPQLLNVASGAVSLFMLMLWWRRRGEAALGTFSALGILTSARNYGYGNVIDAVPTVVGDWAFFAAQVISVSLLGFFAMAFTGRRPTWFQWSLRALLGGLLLAGTVMAGWDRLDELRAVAYPVLLFIGLTALALIVMHMRTIGWRARAGLVGAISAVVAAGVHDYLRQQGHTGIMGTYLLPYAIPLMMTAFSGLLMQRVVRAMQQVEDLNLSLEHRVQDRTQALQQANQAKSRFIAAASHDLRQPVVTIGLLVGLLREQVSAPRLRDLIDRINEAVAALEDLLKGLLDLSRFDAGTVKPRLQGVPLQGLFDAIAAHESEAARLKGVRLRFRPTGLAVRSDPVLLEQILRNLVNNAVRYTDAGGVLVGVRPRGEGRVSVEVWDTGSGITPAQQQTVFDEFTQFEPGRNHRVRGLGLGLALVKRAALLLEHPLRLRSRPGRGSCFALTLPLAVAEAHQGVTAMTEARPLQGLRLLLVEDEPTVLQAMQMQLERWGATVHPADGLGALDRLLADPDGPCATGVDMVISDNRLPDGDSVRVVGLVRRKLGTITALIVTGPRNCWPRSWRRGARRASRGW